MFVRTPVTFKSEGEHSAVAFVKLDCGMLTSTIWDDYPARSIFITALLMAEPREFRESVPQIEVRTLTDTGWCATPGWYGFVPAAGMGIIKRAGDLDADAGYAALERLGSPEPESRSQDHEGRRLIRIDGGYLILNYDKYRQRDYGAAERMRRLREKRKTDAEYLTPHRYSSPINRHVTANDTHTEAEADTEKRKNRRSSRSDKTFSSDSMEFKAASHLLGLIKRNNPTAKEPNLQKWAATFDAIFRIDKRDAKDVRVLLDWCQGHHFWATNILSPEAFRKQYDQLTVQRRNPLAAAASTPKNAPYKPIVDEGKE